ncbi:Uncharacterized protein QJS10_CPA08g01810 [Acorus calamus]|uniref:O-fucosyltransferase family protein n=1 Tax=Acorus calamus TaxID=4465 RepID=A0AAV9EDU6_ACOCL|nr:Uncharacterized protein QJS10_CPA08g01810 [Acorus calamus]
MMFFFKSRIKWAALLGLVLTALSLSSHLLLARYTGRALVEYEPPLAIFSWGQKFEYPLLSTSSRFYRRLWGPVRPLESLLPAANPRAKYEAPNVQTNGYIFVRIQGDFHEIRSAICDAVVIARLLNAILVIPELQSTTSSKGVSSSFKSFAYLYNEDQFIVALARDVMIVKTLPKNFKTERRKRNIPVFKVSYSASPSFYVEKVLPVLKQHSVVELAVSNGGCLQAILPPELEEYQRLRCRVAFHGLIFRQEVQELGLKILQRLRSSGRPFLAYYAGITKDALAYHGCAELFQDVHTELIQQRRSWMIDHKLIKREHSIDSTKHRVNGSCPLMPEEVGILLRTFGYSSDTIIYVSGGEIFGGQRMLIPLRSMFQNVVDRTSLSMVGELMSIYGHENHLTGSLNKIPSLIKEEEMVEAWKKAGPRPRPLPPPPARAKFPSSANEWWESVFGANKEPETEIVVLESRTNAHKLLWEAIDYMVSVEADAFFPGFDRDGKGRPNVASLVMGHRLYLYAASKTFRPNRKYVSELLEETRDHLYQVNQTWLASMRTHLNSSTFDHLTESYLTSKSISFLSHPVPECLCLRQTTSEVSSHAQVSVGVDYQCPSWMNNNDNRSSDRELESEEEFDNDNDDDASLGQFFQQTSSDGVVDATGSNREEPHMEDQEELESGER